MTAVNIKSPIVQDSPSQVQYKACSPLTKHWNVNGGYDRGYFRCDCFRQTCIVRGKQVTVHYAYRTKIGDEKYWDKSTTYPPSEVFFKNIVKLIELIEFIGLPVDPRADHIWVVRESIDPIRLNIYQLETQLRCRLTGQDYRENVPIGKSFELSHKGICVSGTEGEISNRGIRLHSVNGWVDISKYIENIERHISKHPESAVVCHKQMEQAKLLEHIFKSRFPVRDFLERQYYPFETASQLVESAEQQIVKSLGRAMRCSQEYQELQEISEKSLSLHNEIVRELITLQNFYNTQTEITDKTAIERKVHTLNGRIAQKFLSNSELQLLATRVHFLVASSIKLIQWRLETPSLDDIAIPPKMSFFQFMGNFPRLFKEVSCKTLQATAYELKGRVTYPESKRWSSDVYRILQRKFSSLTNTVPILMPPEEVKNGLSNDFDYYRSHLNLALTRPYNWKPIYHSTILMSAEGRAYTSSTELTPLDLDESGSGVPAGLRDDENFRLRPVNLFKTEHVLYDDNGEKISKTTTFRGGQFPTPEAAERALIEILSQGKVKALHINCLLTPTVFTKIKKDRTLLFEHKENILDTLEKFKSEAYARAGVQFDEQFYTFEELCALKDGLIFSNFGVNEGAVGEAGGLKMGWHKSIGDYSNDAIMQLNEQLRKAISELNTDGLVLDETTTPIINNLGALIHNGLEMEEIWASNDFASAIAGNNQFKLPAYWKVMDMLLGITSYTNCMSGKDRTGEVESSAQHLYSEIVMKLADHKENIKKVVIEQNQPVEELDLLLSICGAFTEEEVEQMIVNGQCSREALAGQVEKKVLLAKIALNFPEGLLSVKDVSSSPLLRNISHNMQGISTSPPKRHSVIIQDAASAFPVIAPISYYSKSDDLLRLQREARNRRYSLMPSLQVTAVNTGFAGFKLGHNPYLKCLQSGFSREYVMDQLKDNNEITDIDAIDLLGLHELDMRTIERVILNLNCALGMKGQQRMKALANLITHVETCKIETLSPQGKVDT